MVDAKPGRGVGVCVDDGRYSLPGPCREQRIRSSWREFFPLVCFYESTWAGVMTVEEVLSK